MSDTIITVENLGKKYRIRHERERYTALRDVIARKASAPFRRLRNVRRPLDNETAGQQDQSPVVRSQLSGSPRTEEFWALKDVSFEVRQGEVLGIIGRNGAGKTTLLKILSRITEPTEGRVRIRGRVASLLEVGTGFHPELTGRENIFLNGAILGMSRAEIKSRFDEIVAFAETEKFLDTPVKRYSSGMYVRLAFAVAAHLEPEILVVDEVLAVGDAEFQKKCLGKMQDVSRGGRTVLFVSHQMQAINRLCSRALLLERGRIIKDGHADDVSKYYLADALGKNSQFRERIWDDISSAPGNALIRIRRVAVVPEGDNGDSTIEMSTPFRIEVDYWNLTEGTKLIINLYIFASDGTLVLESLTTGEQNWFGQPHPKGLFRSVCFVPEDLLNQGTFTIRINFINDQLLKLFDFEDAAVLQVSDTKHRGLSFYNRFGGYVHPQFRWQTDLIGDIKGARGQNVKPEK